MEDRLSAHGWGGLAMTGEAGGVGSGGCVLEVAGGGHSTAGGLPPTPRQAG